MNKKIIIFCHLLLLFFSCSKWKVNELKQKLLFTIPVIKNDQNKIRDDFIKSLLLDYKLTPIEIENIDKKDIDTYSKIIIIKNDQKNKIKKKNIPLKKDTFFLLEKYLKIRDSFDKKSNFKAKALFINNKRQRLGRDYITNLYNRSKNSKNNDYGKVSLNFSNNDILNITFSLNVYRDKIYLVDNILKHIQVFNVNGKPDLVIGNNINPKNKEITGKRFKFGIIGKLISDSEGKIYIQNRLILSDENKKDKDNKNNSLDISPSYLLVFNHNGELQYTLGQRGTTDIPFNYIEKLFVDNKDRIFVISKTFGTWNIYRFSQKKRDLYVKFSTDMFIEKENDNEYGGEIENIQIFNSGEKLLLSIAYYHNTRFKYRKIIEYSVSEKKIIKTLLDIPDPRNELFNLLDDKYILLWDVEEKDIKFVVKNFQGNIINNIRIKLNTNNDYFEQIILNEKGKFYTYRVIKEKGIEIREWE